MQGPGRSIYRELAAAGTRENAVAPQPKLEILSVKCLCLPILRVAVPAKRGGHPNVRVMKHTGFRETSQVRPATGLIPPVAHATTIMSRSELQRLAYVSPNQGRKTTYLIMSCNSIIPPATIGPKLEGRIIIDNASH